MATWQLVFIAAVVVLPLLLLAFQHPAKERLSAGGVPMARAWRPAPPAPEPDDEHH